VKQKMTNKNEEKIYGKILFELQQNTYVTQPKFREVWYEISNDLVNYMVSIDYNSKKYFFIAIQNIRDLSFRTSFLI
jgi:hypothetical protein